MWAAAQIGKISLGIKSDVAIFKPPEQIQFVLISFFFKITNSFVLGNFLADIGVVLFGKLFHFLFQFIQITFGDGLSPQIHIIIKPIVNRGAYPEFGTGK